MNFKHSKYVDLLQHEGQYYLLIQQIYQIVDKTVRFFWVPKPTPLSPRSYYQYCVFIIGSTKARLLINHQAELLCYQFIPLLYLTVGECQAIVTSIPERGIFPCFKKLTIFLLKIAHFKKFFNSFPLGHKYLNSCISYYLFYYL